MLKNIEKYYSPNFNPAKRSKNKIKFIIIHYTGMKKEKHAIERLTNIQSEVSCHYFIQSNGKIIQMIPELYIAWHAGKSKWKNSTFINSSSLGIELSNPGHNFGYKKFNKRQITSLIYLLKNLSDRYKISNKNILGHSDIAPERKKDPGEKFPWKYLARKKMSFWHKLSQNELYKSRNLKISKNEKSIFFRNLNKIGYSLKNKFSTTKAFQRRFRQELINGKIDKECFIISNSLKSI
tara:strand:+ start:1346 stop:2056 length:711 start_codon:yes stop_codon:yes gene_type:complete